MSQQQIGAFLASLVGSRRDAAKEERLRGVDWDGVVKLARSHAVTPIVERQLRHTSAPRTTQAALREQAETVAATNLALSRDLVSACEALKAAGITAVPFKGMPLAERLYGDVSLRPSLDIDLVVMKTDVLRAREVLRTLDYSDGSNGDRVQWMIQHGNEFTLVRSADARVADLQWALAPAHFGFDIDLKSFFMRARTIPFAGVQLASFAPEDELLLLLLHGGKHLWERLIWINDIALLVRRDSDIDWTRVLDAARQARQLRLVLVGLRLATALDGQVVLDPYLTQWMRRDPGVEWVARRVWARTLTRDPAAVDPPVHILTIAQRERRRDKAMLLAKLALTPTPGDRDWVELPGPFSWAYVGLRPIRLTLKYGGRAIAGRQ